MQTVEAGAQLGLEVTLTEIVLHFAGLIIEFSNRRAMALYTCGDKGNKRATGTASEITSDQLYYLNSVTPITYLTVCILLIWYGL